MNKWDIVDYAKIQSDILKEVFKKIDNKKYKPILYGDYNSDVGYIINSHLLVIIPQAFNMLSLPCEYNSMAIHKLIPSLSDFEKATNYNTVTPHDKLKLRLIENDNTQVQVNDDYLKYFNLENEYFSIYIKDRKTPVIFFDEYTDKILGLLMPVVNY